MCLFVCLSEASAQGFKFPKKASAGIRTQNQNFSMYKSFRVGPASRDYCLSYGPRNFLIKLYIVTTLRVLCHKYKRPHRQPLQVATPRSAPCMYLCSMKLELQDCKTTMHTTWQCMYVRSPGSYKCRTTRRQNYAQYA